MDKTIAVRVAAVRENPDQLNKFIEEYKPFIASCVQKNTGKYVEYGIDDELSIGLMAFHEAVNKYDQKKGSFLTFANQIIQRRLIDYYRTQKKFYRETSFNTLQKDADFKEEYDCTSKESIQKFSKDEIERMRRVELEELRNELSEWGLNFFDVAKASPKIKSTRKIYLDIIDYIVKDKEAVKIMKDKKYLPISKICEATHINRKKVERGRNYIIAGVLILLGEYDYIRDFIHWR